MAMADFLSVVAADYTATELQVTPQRVMTERGRKSQIIYETDGAGLSVVSKSNESIFEVTLQWEVLSETDAETIEDMYHSATKANASENTFYWHHPKETNIYTVRFLTELEKVYSASMPSFIGVAQCRLRVEGKKS